MRAFISQPMKGKTTEQIKEERAILEKNLCKLGYEIIDSVFEDFPSDSVKNKSVWYLGKSLQTLSQADIVFFMPGWNNASGCRQEMSVCKVYGIKNNTIGTHSPLLELTED